MKLYHQSKKNGLKRNVASHFFNYRKKNPVFMKYRKKIIESSCINFYKEVFQNGRKRRIRKWRNPKK